MEAQRRVDAAAIELRERERRVEQLAIELREREEAERRLREQLEAQRQAEAAAIELREREEAERRRLEAQHRAEVEETPTRSTIAYGTNNFLDAHEHIDDLFTDAGRGRDPRYEFSLYTHVIVVIL